MKKNMFNVGAKWLCAWLLLALLPRGVWAQDNSQAMLYVEKTDGSVVKFPIIKDYPRLVLNPWGKVALDVTYFDQYEQTLSLITSEIKRMYTGFETTGITEMRSDVDAFSENVYSLSGRLVGRDRRALESQPKGVYVVKKGHQYQKIVKP